MRSAKLTLFKRFLLSYILIAALPIFVGGLTYFASIRIVENEMEQYYYNSLYQSSIILDKNLEQINSTIDRISETVGISTFLQADYETVRRSPSILEICKTIELYQNSDPSIDHLMIYSKKSGAFLTYNGLVSLEKDYGTRFSAPNMTADVFSRTFLAPYAYRKIIPDVDMTFYDRTDSRWVYLHTIPVGEKTNFQGTVLATIHPETVMKVLSNMAGAENGSIYIINEHDQVVTHLGPDLSSADLNRLIQDDTGAYQMIDNRYVYSIRSEYNRWKYIALLPKSTVLSKISALRFYVLLFILVSLVFCGLAAYLLAFKNSAPFTKLLDKLRSYTPAEEEEPPIHSEIDELSTAVNSLMQSDESRREQLEKSLPMLKFVFLEKLLNGGFNNADEIEQNQKLTRLDFSAQFYSVVLIWLTAEKNIASIPAAKLLIHDFLEEKQKGIYCVEQLNDEISIILPIAEKNENFHFDVEELVNQLCTAITGGTDIFFNVAVGNPVGSLEELFLSYREARDALDTGIMTSAGKVIWYIKSMIETQAYFYPLDVETRLMKAAVSQKQDIVMSLLDLIEEENFRKRVLTTNDFKTFYYDLRGSVLKIVQSLNCPEQTEAEINELLASLDKTMEHYTTDLTAFRRIFSFICENEEIHAGNNHLKQKMLQFIAQEYTNPDFGRYAFAEHFNISEKYTSQYFKDNTGYNFSEYLEKVRIEKACELIRRRKWSIEEIAKMTGYNSDTSFRRAFKRYTGMSPGGFSKM